MFRSVVVAVLLVAGAAVPAEDAWDRLLGSAELTRETARFDMLDMANYGGHEFILPFFSAIHQDPLRIPFYSRILRQNLITASPSLHDLLSLGGLRIGEGTRRTLVGDPIAGLVKLAEAPDALPRAVRAMLERADGAATANRLTESVRRQAAAVPRDVAAAAALLLQAELKFLEWRDRSLAALSPREIPVLLKTLARVDAEDDSVDLALRSWAARIDWKLFLAGAEDLALAADRAAAKLANRAGGERFQFDVPTRLGRIRIRGAGDDIHSFEPPLLILDTGGSDRYLRAGDGTPVSVCLDLGGDDRYEMETAPIEQVTDRKTDSGRHAFGSGALGCGILLDLAGNDRYRSLGGQGSGLFGVGLLMDRAGDDRYDGYRRVQGAARFGVGIAADLAGKDQYRCFTRGQGFGETRGFGALLDLGPEDDLYDANDTVIDFPSAQTKEHNASLAQGCGFGRRADITDGHSLAGGIGVLLDQGGSNRFSCGLFGQGAGYWYGAGFLLAGPGDDSYRGIWYVQGASAHFAAGILDEAGGNDRYVATINMALGAGHDFGPGFLIDRAGNDRYDAGADLSLGAGNANGMGFFWDLSGNDTYLLKPSRRLGGASIEGSGRNSLRERNLTLGLFLDTGGTDAYPAEMGWARDNRGWTLKDAGLTPPLPTVRGAGLDVEAAGTPEPR